MDPYAHRVLCDPSDAPHVVAYLAACEYVDAESIAACDGVVTYRLSETSFPPGDLRCVERVVDQGVAAALSLHGWPA